MQPNFDPTPLLALCEATDPATVKDIVEIFAADAPGSLVTLDQALAAGDPEGVRRAAHRMKGTAGTIGLIAAQETCAAIEKAAKAADLATVRPLAAALATSIERGLAAARAAC